MYRAAISSAGPQSRHRDTQLRHFHESLSCLTNRQTPVASTSTIVEGQ